MGVLALTPWLQMQDTARKELAQLKNSIINISGRATRLGLDVNAYICLSSLQNLELIQC